ncbi:MAG: hypothetical protein ACE5RK_08170, partial [Candidatus Nitrosomaritimum aestuariumsis]
MGTSRVALTGILGIIILATFTISPAFAYQIFLVNPEDYDKLPEWIKEVIEWEVGSENFEAKKEKANNLNEQFAKPTFGLDHESNQKIIEGGFKINNQTFSIDDNFHTPFEEQIITIGETNSFEVKIFASKGLKVQEFLFGIPQVGDAHLAELGVEVWFGYDGEIQQVKTIQKSNVIDEESFEALHEKTKCKSSEIEENCDLVKLSAIFLEPLKHKVMALKAIDFKNRYQITYLNEGIEISGKSLNPNNIEMIPSGIKGEGLIKVTQVKKYSPYWISEDQRLFEKNRFGSFKEINFQFERFNDKGNVKNRSHSGFGGILDYEQKRATKIFDASSLISDTPESF